jgi:hypothetical protein
MGVELVVRCVLCLRMMVLLLKLKESIEQSLLLILTKMSITKFNLMMENKTKSCILITVALLFCLEVTIVLCKLE